MSMGGLRARLKRIEARAKHSRAPTPDEYLDAAFRQRVRNAYSARWKLWQIKGWDEDVLRGSFSPEDLAVIDANEDLQEKDRQIIERYQRSQGTDDETAGIASRCKAKLKAMTRIT